MFSSDGNILPIFHAQTITKVRDETNVRFMNTPEGFTPQNDMLTWENGVVKEEILTYAVISPGETTLIQGRAYCGPEHLGKNIIVAQAYCACTIAPNRSSNCRVLPAVVSHPVCNTSRKYSSSLPSQTT